MNSMNTKYNLIVSLIFLFFTINAQASKQPDWVKKRPSDPLAYIGVAYGDKSNPQYMEEAKKKAINDLLSEIKIEVQSSSLLKNVEKDNQVYSYLSNEIKTKTQEELEQLQMVDNWEDKNQYWVYYRLSKLDYDYTISQRKMKATENGYSYWVKGNEALEIGDLFAAIELYTKGIEAVQTCSNQQLIHVHNGIDIHVDTELYKAINTLFNGITLESIPQSIHLQGMHNMDTHIQYSLHRNETPLSNLKLDIDFVLGSGLLQSTNTTNSNGIATVNLAKVTANLPNQEIQAKLNTNTFARYKNPIIEKSMTHFMHNPPKASTFLNVELAQHKAYIRFVGVNNELLAKSIRNILTNNYFTVVNDSNQADVLILIKSSITKGDKVKGEMYDFFEYFTNIEIQIADTNTSEVYLNYAVTNNKSLAKTSTSETSATNSAMKDALRVVERGLKKELQKTNINQLNDNEKN